MFLLREEEEMEIIFKIGRRSLVFFIIFSRFLSLFISLLSFTHSIYLKFVYTTTLEKKTKTKTKKKRRRRREDGKKIKKKKKKKKRTVIFTFINNILYNLLLLYFIFIRNI